MLNDPKHNLNKMWPASRHRVQYTC